MPRLANLDDVFFAVEMRPLFVKHGSRDMRLPDRQAVVEARTGRVLGVVSRAYRLVTHEEALDLAFECARSAFPETKTAEWAPAAVDAPATGATSIIDLTHNSAALDFSCLAATDRPDSYGPFVRVTNSYNGTRALGFDIGYYRKVCKNGLILRDSLIQFRMSHQRRDIGARIRFEIAHDKLDKQRQDFIDFLAKLQGYDVPEAMIGRFACGVLGFRPPDDADLPNDHPRCMAWRELARTVDETSDRYCRELGANANTVLNVVTDIASHPPESQAVRRDRHGLQRRAGQWASGFATVCEDDGFDLMKYLEAMEKPGVDPDKLGRGVALAEA